MRVSTVEILEHENLQQSVFASLRSSLSRDEIVTRSFGAERGVDILGRLLRGIIGEHGQRTASYTMDESRQCHPADGEVGPEALHSAADVALEV